MSQGRSYVLFGPHSGGEWSLGGADLVFDGAMGSAVFGGSVGAGGDVDGDGVDDLLVSANYEDALGAAYLWFGPVTSGGDSSSADLRIGAQAGDVRLGLNLSMGGDCSGDGLGDIAVMAYEGPDAGDMAGVVYFFDTAPTGSVDTSAASAVMWGEDDSSYAGMDMAMGGDVNGDGYGDLAIGAYGLRPPGQYTSDGAAYVVFGPLTASGSLGPADFRVLGEWTDGHTGISVSIDGDVNGDGRDDLLVGSDESVHYTTGGGASLFYGPVTGSMWTSDSDAHFPAQYEDDYAGQSVAIIPSLDSDVYADLAIGVQRDNTASTHAGAVYLFYGGEY